MRGISIINAMNDLIVKSNKLIEAQYRLNLIESRLVLKLASTIEKYDTDFKIYTFKVADLLAEFEMGKENYHQIGESTKSLLKRLLVIRTSDNLKELQINFLSSAEYDHRKGTVELCFDPKLKPYLLQLKENFTSYRLEYVKRLKKVYAIRFYEFFKQYQKIGRRRMKIREIRDHMSIDKNKYPMYADFKKRVILSSQQELIEKTDIRFEFKEFKYKRKVEEIEFIIYHNNVDYKVLDRRTQLKKQARKVLRREKPKETTASLF